MDITSLRLQNHHLVGFGFSTPEEVVGHFGAVQAQDYLAAEWTLGLRMKNATAEIIEKAFNEGKFLRTHVMRPTWHFVMPEDLVWMQKLTSDRVKMIMNTYNKKLELTDALFAKSEKAIVKALRGENYLTRRELKRILEDIGIVTNVQRLAHIVMYPELNALICSGPLKGRQFTYALVDERIEKPIKLTRDEALATLATKYFQSHGPAQLKDFSWWSGLKLNDAAEALGLIKSKLSHETIENKEYWFIVKTGTDLPLPTSSAFLLSIFDEYTIAYKDRSDLSESPGDVEKLLSMGNTLTSVIIINGKVVGTWKRVLKKDKIEITLDPFRKFNLNEKKGLEKAVIRYGKFLGLPAFRV